MSEGGIYDHLGGGFSRYSVDERWLVPHFEKMLYDNAQLLELLALALCSAPATRCSPSARAETVGWLKREMTTPEGAFAASLDADSEGEEGKFYVWSLDEIVAVLGEHDADDSLPRHYDVSAGGNFEGHNILNRLTYLPRSMDGATRRRLAAQCAHELPCCAVSTTGARAARARRQGAGRLERTDDRRSGQCRASSSNEPAWLAHGGARLRLHRAAT